MGVDTVDKLCDLNNKNTNERRSVWLSRMAIRLVRNEISLKKKQQHMMI